MLQKPGQTSLSKDVGGGGEQGHVSRTPGFLLEPCQGARLDFEEYWNLVLGCQESSNPSSPAPGKSLVGPAHVRCSLRAGKVRPSEKGLTPDKMCLPWTETHLCVLFFPSTAQVSGLNVVASRSFESTRGIEVMDKEGNVVGFSRRAGTKVGGALEP